MRWHQLSAIVPVGLISVIFFRIMRSRTHHTPLTTQVADGKTEFRCGPERLEKKNLNAVGSKYFCRSLCEKTAVVSAVMGYGNLYLIIREGFYKVIRISLGGHSDRIFIDTVRTDPHYSAKPTGTEFQVLIKTVCKFSGIFFLQSYNFIFCFLII